MISTDKLIGKIVDNAFPAAATLIALAWAGGLHWRMGLLLYTEQALAVIVGLVLALVFLRVAPNGEPQQRPAAYDWIAAITGFVTCIYISVRYPQLVSNLYFEPLEASIVSLIIIVLAIEAARRTTGLALIIVFLLFLGYALWGDAIPGILRGRTQPFFQTIPILGLDSSGFFGAPLTVVVTVVVAFLFMGQLLVVSGGGDFFTDLAAGLMGRFRGGAAKIAVVASALFGSISGSVVSNVASTGMITIPLMKRSGFKPSHAGAIEAVASTGGQIMPPIMGAAAFLMADFLQVSYGAVLVAALIPAGLYFLAVLIQVDLEAARRNIQPVPRDEIPPILGTLKKGWYFIIPFVVLIVALFSFNMPPETAAIIGAFSMIALSLVFSPREKKLMPGRVYRALIDTGAQMVQIVVICTIAGMIIGSLNISGLNFSLGLILIEAGQGSLFLLLILTGIVCIILGMSMPTTSLYILLAAIAAPPIIQLGAEPMAAHMFVFYFGMMSMITPPVCFAAFAAANIAGADPMRTGWVSMRYGWVAYIVPFLFVFSPTLLMDGDAAPIVIAVVTAVLGVWMISASMMGYLFSHLSWPQRIAFGLAGLALLTPAGAFPGGFYVELAGGVLGGVLIVQQFAGRRKRHVQSLQSEEVSP